MAAVIVGGAPPPPPAAPPAPPPRRWGSDGAKMFVAGGAAGALARTVTAPLDRIKLLFQVQAVASSGAGGPRAYTGVAQAAAKIWREEGFMAFWKGNGVNVVRVFPYSAAQLAANDLYKRTLASSGWAVATAPRAGAGGSSSELTVAARLAAGAAAGMTATALTHPLDVVRLRLALPDQRGRAGAPPAPAAARAQRKGALATARAIVQAEGPAALYRGLVPSLAGIAPYAAVNFAGYDAIKRWLYDGGRPQSAAANLLAGATSGTLAATACYPLDTVRRRMQLPGRAYAGGPLAALAAIWRAEGAPGLYRGWAANTLKVVPQNAARLVAYDALKGALGVARARSDT